MARQVKTKSSLREKYVLLIAEQEKWIKSCGGDLAGYIERYGEATDPKRYGDGGAAIYNADTNALKRYQDLLSKCKN